MINLIIFFHKIPISTSKYFGISKFLTTKCISILFLLKILKYPRLFCINCFLWKNYLCNRSNENKKDTGLFFANIQNKLFNAIVEKTAAEIIFERANHELVNMGLTNFEGTRVRKADVIIAKNYLKEKELKSLERLVVMFLDFIENYVERNQEPIYTKDREERTNEFLKFYKYSALNGFGKKTKKEADEKAENEYVIYDNERKKQEKIEADKQDLKEIEELKKELKEAITTFV